MCWAGVGYVSARRCVDQYSVEELRLSWGDLDPAKPAYYQRVLKRRMPPVNRLPPGFLPSQVVGPVGWHLHSFASTAHVLYKLFTRAGRYSTHLDADMDQMALDKRKECAEVRARRERRG